jgi:mevalonate kinase
MKASAPGKIFLFGEHAVVYGKRALVTAINLRCFATVKKRSDFRISSSLGITGLDYEKHPYISYAIRRFTEFKKINGADIEIESQIPIASGLGSSSAVTVSVLKALDAEYEAGLTNEEIYEIAKKVELDVQGIASGTDPFISTYGGCWLIPERKPVKIGNIYFLVIDTGIKSITGDMVKKVAELRREFQEIVDGIMDVIDKITVAAIPNLDKMDLTSISKLMFINQALLNAIGVSTKTIDEIVAELNSMGIAAKLTGAGGGGCVIGVGEIDMLTKATERFKSAFFVKSEKEGARIEELEKE